MTKRQYKLKSHAVGMAGILSVLAVSFVASAVPAMAAQVAEGDATTPATWSQTVEINPASVITLDASLTGNVTLAADATVDSGFATKANTLTVATNDAKGFDLTLAMTGSDTHSGALWSATNSSEVARVGSVTTLTDNTWGYALGATAPTLASNFNPVPTGSGANILTMATAGNDSVTVNYGTKIGYDLPSGATYSNQVLYTATIKTSP